MRSPLVFFIIILYFVAYFCYTIFNKFDIWKYLEECYDTLHMNGDDYILNDIEEIIVSRGGVL